MQKLTQQQFKSMLMKLRKPRSKKPSVVYCKVCGTVIPISEKVVRIEYCSTACKHSQYADDVNANVELRDEIIRLYMDGKTFVEIKEATGVSWTKLSCFKQKYL